MKDIEIVNGYEIRYNCFWDRFMVSHSEIGACIAEFDTKIEAIEYAKNG